jgi:hypothetical protein
MALTRMHHVSRRHTIGPAKRFEMAGDTAGMVEAMAKIAEAYGDVEEARRLRGSLRERPIVPKTLDTSESEPTAYTPEPKRKRSQPTPSPDKKLRAAWRTVDELRGRAD